MRVGSPALATVVRYGVLVAFGAFLWWVRAQDIGLLYAAYGFGPMAYTHKRCHPERFARDFPSGVENFDKSAPMHAYPLAYRCLGIPPERLMSDPLRTLTHGSDASFYRLIPKPRRKLPTC